MTKTRHAQPHDIPEICALDHLAQTNDDRRRFICDAVHDAAAHVAVVDGGIAGYMVFAHSFFNRGFIAMLYVHPDHRRTGVGSALVRHAEDLCRTDRIFTSTNRSNLPMQALLNNLGYTWSGIVADLDPGDPELFYSRQLRGRAPE